MKAMLPGDGGLAGGAGFSGAGSSGGLGPSLDGIPI